MLNPIPHIINNNIFWISPERTLYWEDQKSLIVADLHLGKTGHFRKSGIGVPQSIYNADLQRLIAQLYLYKIDRLIIVGDFTHSIINKELDLFLKWRNDFSLLEIDLVKGNHDILGDSWYQNANIKIHEWDLLIDGFCFRHEDKKSNKKENKKIKYTFTGHLHPGISIKGKGKQSLTFPCFYFKTEQCILPAFSRFTGTFKVKPVKGEFAYAIIGKEIIKMN